MMRKLMTFAVLSLLVLPVVAMESAMEDAIRHGAMAKICYRIIDDEGCPVSNAVAHVWFSSYARHQDDADWLVTTDTNGMFTVEHRTNESLDCGFDKDGYYHSSDQILFRDRKDVSVKVKDGKWQPYGETRTLVLKKIKNPIQIGEFCRCSVPIPVYDEWVGFDFEQRRWTPPHGDGKYSDVLLKFGRELVHSQFDYKMTMEVSFTNNPYAGFYQMKADDFSERKTTYQADPCAEFCRTIRYVQERHPGSPRVDNRLDEDSYLIFRTRTKTDKDGKLISAHYGIIRGRWSFFSSMLSRGYLFNPTPNDTNLEDSETAQRSIKRRRQEIEREQRKRTAGVAK